MARDMVKVVGSLGKRDAASQAVDFPSFVAGLLHGVFQGVVDASVQQMDAYAKLLSEAAESLQAVRNGDAQLASARQRVLGTTLLMGINRIVVTDGKIPPRAKVRKPK